MARRRRRHPLLKLAVFAGAAASVASLGLLGTGPKAMVDGLLHQVTNKATGKQ